VVVNRTAIVMRGGEEVVARANESIYSPLGTGHRTENRGPIPPPLIEVQFGNHLGKGDITRYENTHGGA
jgi:mannose-6-phosphate isomerase-like protein (cupin superfamily)